MNTYTKDNPKNHMKIQQISVSIKKHVDSCNKIFQKITSQQIENEKFLLKYTDAIQKLNLFYNEIQKQVEVFLQVLTKVNLEHYQIMKKIAAVYENMVKSLTELEKALFFLKKKKIHKTISLRKSMGTLDESGSEKSRLYDFVNIKQVDLLLKRGKEKVKRILEVKDLGGKVLARVLADKDNIMKANNELKNNVKTINNQNSLSLDGGINWNPKESVFKSTEVIKIVKKIKEEIEEIYATLLNKLIKVDTGSGNDVADIDVNFYIKEEEKIRTVKMKIVNDGQISIESNSLLLRTANKKMHNFYLTAKKVYDDLEKLSRAIPKKLKQIKQLKNMYKQTMNDDKFLFDEIRELTIWYVFFPISYDNTLLEIMRRNEIFKGQIALVSQMGEKLKQMYEEEESERQKFFELYGKFLPTNLLPQLMDPQIKYTIDQHPKKDHDMGINNLPKIQLTNEEVEEIKKNSEDYYEKNQNKKGKEKKEDDSTKENTNVTKHNINETEKKDDEDEGSQSIVIIKET